MRHGNIPFAKDGFMDVCVKLAQTAFFDDLPSNTHNRPPTAPAQLPPQLVAAPALHQRWLAALEGWMHRMAVKDREAYLSQSRDVHDLEARIRRMEGPRHY